MRPRVQDLGSGSRLLPKQAIHGGPIEFKVEMGILMANKGHAKLNINGGNMGYSKRS